jgi:hypothetical protein
VAEAEPLRPAEDGLDAEEKLRNIDLYQPTPDPDRPGPVTGRPAGRRDQVLLAQAPAPPPVTALPVDPAEALEEAAPEGLAAGAAEDIQEVVADLRMAAQTNTEAADRVFVNPPPEWEGQGFPLPALAGLALWLAPACRPDPASRAQHEQQRTRGRPGNRRADAGYREG